MTNKIERIIIHWDAGTGKINELAKKHYHRMIDRQCKFHDGLYKPEDNFNTSDGKYSAHSAGYNSNSMGYSFLGMFGFQSPQHVGDFPITEEQFEAGCEDIAKFCIKYDLEINEDTVFTHYELSQRIQSGKIKRTALNSANIGKIDICYLPFEPFIKPDKVGNYFRDKIRWYKIKLEQVVK